MAKRQPTLISIPDAFGVNMTGQDEQSPALVPGFTEPGPKTPPRKTHYRHRLDHLQAVVAAYTLGHPLALSGPTGSGKTDLVVDFLAGLNLEPEIMGSSDENETTDFIGLRLPDERGLFPFRDGPVARAVRENRPLLIDEADRNRPGVLAKLNHILDGHPLYIESTGEILRPGPGFWVVVTMNTRGHGDESGSMASALVQDQATMGRFLRLEVPYNTEAEKEVVTEILGGDAPAQLLANLVGELRQPGSDLSIPVGTRQVIRFAEVWRSTGMPEVALHMAFEGAAPTTEREVIRSIFHSIFPAQQDAGNDSAEDQADSASA